MNFSIEFTYPWLLLLLIPTLAVVAYTFFKVNKRFRYSSNKIVSVILCSLMVILSVFMISGMNFEFDKKNNNNEVVLLVDYSDSNNESIEAKNEFVKNVIDNNPKNIKLGIVKFAYDQVCALPMTNNMKGAYDKYINSDNPNNSATNIERALIYANNLIENKSTSKVVILSDGIETDGDALKAVAEMTLQGTRIDVVDYENKPVTSEIQVDGVEIQKEAIVINESAQMELNVKSSVSTDIQLKVYDNNVEVQSRFINLSRGDNKIIINHVFKEKGLHELAFIAESADDTSLINNKLYSFVNIDTIDKILILQRDNESEKLEDVLNTNYKINVKNIKEAPMNVDELRDFDQVILQNIANKDMPDGFIQVLNEYVSEYGGGLLTVGGLKEENGKLEANTYNREDMKDSLYQDMIPVIAEDYKPPVAVTLVIDISGSMFGTVPDTDRTLMEEAKASAKAALDALDYRDYMGVVVFGKTAMEIIPPTPLTNKTDIEGAIDSIYAKMEPTLYSTGLEKAGIGLKAIDGVNKKHIILISDGAPSGSDGEYLNITDYNYQNNITTSVISYGTKVLALEQIAERGHGNNYATTLTSDSLTAALHKDLLAPEIREYEYKTFKPTIGDRTAVLNGITEEEIPSLNGFFGTRLKNKAKGVLLGEYGEPIYAEWNYGKGKVGSFMCDLSGKWSMEFLSNPIGQKIINNIAGSLFPNKKINKENIELNLTNKNYEIKTNIFTSEKDGELLKYNVKRVGEDKPVLEGDFKEYIGNQVFNVDALEAGIYSITVEKYDKEGQIVSTNTEYQAISYSKEYDAFNNGESHAVQLSKLAKEGEGKIVSSYEQIYEDLVMIYHEVFDLRYIFASLVLVLLLCELAVRKFKFKKLKEIIEDKRNNRK